jgi:hypothetical protein
MAVDKNECRLCAATQSIPETDLVKAVLEKRELTLETLMMGMRDSIVLGWGLRGIQPEGMRDQDVLCEEHIEHVRALSEDDPAAR